jgi:hypothetical protein
LGLRNIAFHETHVKQASVGDPSSSADDGARVALDPDHLSGRTDELSRKHGNVTYARAEVQNTLTGANACIAE